MLPFDAYDTLSVPEIRESIKVQRSEFIAIALPIEGANSFARELHRVQKEYHDATHHCWAWRWLDDADVREQSSDAGEPSGTAGRPILQAIESAGLLDVGVIVVRYYGGVKLGTGGLGRAYRDAAREALNAAPRETRYLYARLALEMPYSALSQVYRLVSPPDVVLVSEEFGGTNRFLIDVRRSRVEAVLRDLDEKRIRVERL